MLYLHAKNSHTRVRNAAGHGDRLVYLVLQDNLGVSFQSECKGTAFF